MNVRQKILLMTAAITLAVGTTAASQPVNTVQAAKKATKKKTLRASVIAQLYNGKGKKVHNRKLAKKLKKGRNIKYYGTKVIKGQLYYKLAKGYYVSAADVHSLNKHEITKATVKTTKDVYVFDRSGLTDKSVINAGQKLTVDKLEYSPNGNLRYHIKNYQANSSTLKGWIDKSDVKRLSKNDLPYYQPSQANLVITADHDITGYNKNGTQNTQLFLLKGNKVTVDRSEYLWLNGQAELMYPVSDVYFKPADVITVSGNAEPINSTQKVMEDNTAATDKSALASLVNRIATTKASDKYVLADKRFKDKYDQDAQEAQKAYSDPNASITQVSVAVNKLTTSEKDLNGVRVQIASADLTQLTASEQESIFKTAAASLGTTYANSIVKFTDSSNSKIYLLTDAGEEYTLNTKDFVAVK